MKVLGQVAASGNGLLVDVIGVVLAVALGLVGVYVVVGVALVPVWAIGALFRVGALRRVGGGWWSLPWMVLDAGEELVERITARGTGLGGSGRIPPRRRAIRSRAGTGRAVWAC